MLGGLQRASLFPAHRDLLLRLIEFLLSSAKCCLIPISEHVGRCEQKAGIRQDESPEFMCGSVSVCPKGWVTLESFSAPVDIMLSHMVRTFHAHFRVWRKERAPVCQTLLWKVYRQRKPLAECCHNVSIRQIYSQSFSEERPWKACCTFSSPLLSCPVCSEAHSLALSDDVLCS